MDGDFPMGKADEALQLLAETREILLIHQHIRDAPEEAVTRLQGLLRALLNCVALIQAYDESPHRCILYAHVSRTLHKVMEIPPDDDKSSRQIWCGDPVEQYEPTAEAAASCKEKVEALGAAVLYPPDRRTNEVSDSGKTNGFRWTTVSGCTEAVAALKRATVLPLRFPHLFKEPRRPPRRILLYGPPGTGKTLLAAAAAAEYGAPLVTVSSADILSKWIGDSERQLRHIFEAASAFSRCVLFFDEIDAVASVRGESGESEASRRVKTELLLCMQRLCTSNITFVAATNIPWGLDTAVLRRFDQLIFVGLPPPEARRSLIVKEVMRVPNELSDGDLEWLVDSTDGYSASDICRITHYAIMEPIQGISLAEYARPLATTTAEPASGIAVNTSIPYAACSRDDEGAVPIETVPPAAFHVPPVCRGNFEAALREFPPTTSPEEVEKFLKWRKGAK